MGARLKRWLFLVHRWLGIGICLLFAMWFASGMVMMYVGYPKLTEEERLQRLPPLQADARLLAPARALAAAGVTGPLDELRLAASSGGRPVYVATPAGHEGTPNGSGAVVIDAVSGQRLRAVDEAHAMASATAFAGPGIARDYLGTIAEDAFTHSRALDPHRPLHKVQLGDAERTLLYISSRSGEVVRDATRSEQLWNYAGAWIHWLYPLRGNAFQPYWTDIVNWLSILGIAMALSGTVVGILRWRFRKPYRSGARTPYPHRRAAAAHGSAAGFGAGADRCRRRAAGAAGGRRGRRARAALDPRAGREPGAGPGRRRRAPGDRQP